MKKWWIPLVLIVGGAGGYLVWKWDSFFGADYSETIFPQDTVIYLAFHDISEAKKNLDQTIFWQKTKESPRKGTYQKQLDRLLNLFESGTGINPKPLIDEFSKDVSVGIFPIAGGKNGGAFAGYVQNEEEAKKFFTTTVAASLKRRFPNTRRSQESYQGITYFKITSSDFPPNASIVYSFLDHRVILSQSESAFQKLVDVKQKKLPPLKDGVLFGKIKNKIEYKRGLLLYLNAENLLKIIHGSVSPALTSIFPALVRISGAESIEAFGYRINVDKEGFSEAGFVSVKPERQGLLKTYMDQPPRHLQSLSSVPATSHFVAAGTLADFGRMWNEANQQLPAILNTEQMDRWNKVQQFMKVILNFDVQKDLLTPLGNEFAFSYVAASEREMQPGKMNYYVALQLKDTEKFRALIQRVETLQWVRNLQKQQETYSGKKIEVFRLQQGTFDMSPSYLFDASWFYFASSPAFLKQSIDAQSKQGGILSVPDFKKVSAGFPDSVNGISYTNVPAYLRMYSAILKKKENASDQFLRGSGLEEEMDYLSPYLFGAATYSVMEKDGIFFRSYASIPSSLLSLLPTLSNLPRYVGSLPR